jgi:hypothetical protein
VSHVVTIGALVASQLAIALTLATPETGDREVALVRAPWQPAAAIIARLDDRARLIEALPAAGLLVVELPEGWSWRDARRLGVLPLRPGPVLACLGFINGATRAPAHERPA